MKKIVLLFAAFAMTVAASAQTVQESKTFDNFYIGVNGGVATFTKGHKWMSDLNPNAGLRIGRYFTPVFGLAVESNAYFSAKPLHGVPSTTVKYLDTNLLGTVNLSNWFGGYKGEPRLFEVVALAGLGWGHMFTTSADRAALELENAKYNDLTSKAAIDFVFNLGAKKAWQFYIEPAILWNLDASDKAGYGTMPLYNLNKSAVQLNAGFVYKFPCSNGTHNFKIAELRDQAEIDGLNAKINELRANLNDKDAMLAAKDAQIRDLQAALDACNNRPCDPVYVKPATATNLQPTVLFRKGKTVIDPAQYAPIELIASYMKNHPEAKIEIKGYASPEGPLELNNKLSEGRANAVMNALIKKYKISADRLSAQGCGPTDELFEELEFNRVATFNDKAK